MVMVWVRMREEGEARKGGGWRRSEEKKRVVVRVRGFGVRMRGEEGARRRRRWW